MKTKDRILQTSLNLFNTQGESGVSTLDICNELDISPGNLYYHFRGKEAIVAHLYAEFEVALSRVEEAFETNVTEFSDYWPYLHVLLAVFEQYRFLFRDVDRVVAAKPELRRRFTRLLLRLKQLCLKMLSHLAARGDLTIEEMQQQILADNMVLVATNWLNYQALVGTPADTETSIRKGVCHMIAMVEPYFTAQTREQYENETQTLLYETLVG